MKLQRLKWRTILGLIVILFAIIFNWNWMWGILFLIWVIPDIKKGYTFFIEPINKSDNPFLYWIIIVMWLLMGIYFLAEPFVPGLYSRYYKIAHPPNVELVELGNYKPEETNKTIVSDEGPTQNSNTDEKQVLNYKSHKPTSFQVAGVSIVTTTFNDQLTKDVKELWDYFYKYNIQNYIPNKADNKIYVVFSEFDLPEISGITITLGYKIASNEGIHKDINIVSIPEMQFAIFEVTSDNNFSNIWETIYSSDLEHSNTFDLEVYTINDTTYGADESEIWVGL